eukprot:scaffold18124_cov65-Phaeocystis_antarctica.AAC.4
MVANLLLMRWGYQIGQGVAVTPDLLDRVRGALQLAIYKRLAALDPVDVAAHVPEVFDVQVPAGPHAN